MDKRDAFAGDELREPALVQQHDQRIFAAGRKWMPNSAIGLQLTDHAAAFACDQGVRANRGKRSGNIDRRAFGATAHQIRDDLQYGASSKRMLALSAQFSQAAAGVKPIGVRAADLIADCS
jgi:hypothetical protein